MSIDGAHYRDGARQREACSMNFERMPELGQGAGYPLVLVFMVAVGAGLYAYFQRVRRL